MNKLQSYRGRFAPSPTGKLHFGSLIAAVASYLQAKSQQGQWLVRIEDIDETRTVEGSDLHILNTLEDFGFEWDDEIVYQSRRKTLYQEYLDQLITNHLIYACDCTRSSLRKKTEHLANPHVYPGICRLNPPSLPHAHALRCKTENKELSFNDQIQGLYKVNLEHDCGDFIVKRRDGFFAYQLAVVIDDAEQQINDIVRGADLLSSTPQQIYLHQLLQITQPNYAHFPVAMHKQGKKLSKSHQDLPVKATNNNQILCTVMDFLNQSPPKELFHSTQDDFWLWASHNWDISKIAGRHQITL